MNDNNTKKRKFKISFFDNEEGQMLSGNITYILAFLIPIFIMLLLYYIKNIYPFGHEAYIRSDMYHQYVPFFSELWNKLRNGGSMTYTWNDGTGTNFTALYAYYLASPLNLIIALFPQKMMLEVMNYLIMFKMALSSLSMTYYLSKHFNSKNAFQALFGMFYGLSGYLAAYAWNIMWLDCIILIPLIILGLERLVNENKSILYSISLGLCIYTNYYIGIMVCLTCVFYFVILILCYEGPKSILIYLKKCIRFAIFSLLAGGLSAILLLPEIYMFSLSASNNIVFPKDLTHYFSFLLVIARQLINIPVHLGLEHFPNIYCGVAIFMLLPMYVMNKKIKTVEKIGKFIILILFMIGFNLNIPNFVWHGLHFPNSLPARHSFIYIFFLLVMCYEAIQYFKEVNTKILGTAFWIAIGILLLLEQTFASGEKPTYDFKTVYISAGFILFYGLLMYLQVKKKIIAPVLLFLTFAGAMVECTINMQQTGFGTTSRDAYLLDFDAVRYVTDEVKKNDNSFYRMDKQFGARCKNDGAWHNYPSMSTFSSTSYSGMSELLGYLGFVHSTNTYGYDGATAVTKSLFSSKYTITNKLLRESDLLSFYTGHDGEFIYENKYVLPLGYMIPVDTDDAWTPNSMYNGIENTNVLMEKITGVKSIFTQTYHFATEITTDFNPVKEGHMYLYVGNYSQCAQIGVNINGNTINYTELKNNNHIIDIGYCTPDDVIQVFGDTTMNLYVYTLETDRFKKAFNILNQQALNITSFSDTKIEGDITVQHEGTFLLSIPYDKGWTLYVDGKEYVTKAFENALISTTLASGYHKIELRYTPVNLYLGLFITLTCIIILIGIYLFMKFFNSGIIKTDRWPKSILCLVQQDDIIYKSEKDDDDFDDDDFDDDDFDSDNFDNDDFDDIESEREFELENELENDIDVISNTKSGKKKFKKIEKELDQMDDFDNIEVDTDEE